MNSRPILRSILLSPFRLFVAMLIDRPGTSVAATLLTIALFIVGAVAHAQQTLPHEFTPECGECTYKLTFGSPDSNGVYYELGLPDPTHPDGRRRVYKGSSVSAYITVRGVQAAALRACYSPYSCSDWTELTLIPPPDAEAKTSPDFRTVPPVNLLHTEGADSTLTNGLRKVGEARSVFVDLSATGQRACTGSVGNRRWNLGTRMIVSLLPDLDLKVVNRELIEHNDGRWTWIGKIEGENEGTVTLTADDCRETAFVSIRSDAGDFAIRPIEAPAHSVYPVTSPADTRDACSPLDTSPTALLEISDLPGGSTLVRRVELVTTRLDELQASLPYLIGEDRNHDLADFLNPAGSVELVPGAAATFDLRDGQWNVASSGDVHWSGCVAGEPDSRLTISIAGHDRRVNVTLRRDSELVSLQSTDAGYEIKSRLIGSD